MIKLWTIPVRIYLARNHSKYFEWKLLREPHHKHLQYPSTSRKCLKSKKLVDPCPDRCSSSRSRPAAEKDNGFQGSRYRYRHTFWHLCRWLARLPFRFMNSRSWQTCGVVSMYFPGSLFAESFRRSRKGSHPRWNFKIEPQNKQLQRSSPQKPGQLSLELRFSSHKCFLVWSCPIHRGKYYY